MRTVVVDTNVAVTANGGAPQASCVCEDACRQALWRITQGRSRLALDETDIAFGEYRKRLSLSGQHGVGDAFMKWVHDNRWNPSHCEQVEVTLLSGGGWRRFEEVPDDDDLRRFDRSDQVYVAISRACDARPQVLNAVDADWWEHEDVLARHGVKVKHVCSAEAAAWQAAQHQGI